MRYLASVQQELTPEEKEQLIRTPFLAADAPAAAKTPPTKVICFTSKQICIAPDSSSRFSLKHGPGERNSDRVFEIDTDDTAHSRVFLVQKWRASELCVPTETMRHLKVPVLHWPAAWRPNTAEGK